MGITSEISEIQKKIKKIEEALKGFDESANEIAEGSSTNAPPNVATDPTSNEKDKDNPKVDPSASPDSKLRQGRVNQLSTVKKSPRKCFSSASGSMEYSESGCKKPLVLNRVELNAELTTPLLTSATNAAIDLGNAIASGDSASADVQAANLASMASKLEALKDNYVAKFNERLKKEGKKPIDGNEEVNKQVAAFESELKAKGILKANSLAELESMLTSEVKNKTGPDKIQVPKQEVIGVKGENKGKEEKFSVDDTSSLSEDVEGSGLSSRLEEFEEGNSDISKDSSRSIFDQVSNRYIRSLPRLLKRRETPLPGQKR